MARQRLHKLLASAGIASRRQCEELIAGGLVTVDGVPVTGMGVLVDPDVQEVRYGGERINAEKHAYYLVYKPKGYLCTNRDEYGRPTVVSLVKDRLMRRLYTVGRLDADSEGLIIVTNDGDFSNRMTHPRFGIDKTYHLKLHGSLDAAALKKARDGVWLSEGKTHPMFVRVNKRSKQFTYVTVLIREGKNRQLRRIFARLGHAVSVLKRVRISEIGTKGMKKGVVRHLTKSEVQGLLDRCQEFERDPLPGNGKNQAKKTGAKKSGARKAGAKKSGARKAGAKKSGARKAGAKKSGAKKAGVRKRSRGKKVTSRRRRPSSRQAGKGRKGRG